MIPIVPALQNFHSWEIKRRADGAVVVRVPSRIVDGHKLPDAVFAFCAGDPQYAFWDAQLRSRESVAPAALPMPIVDVDQNVT